MSVTLLCFFHGFSLLCEAVASLLFVCSFVVVGFGDSCARFLLVTIPLLDYFFLLIKVIFSFHSIIESFIVKISLELGF